jgi:hypothetical protein
MADAAETGGTEGGTGGAAGAENAETGDGKGGFVPVFPFSAPECGVSVFFLSENSHASATIAKPPINNGGRMAASAEPPAAKGAKVCFPFMDN